MSWLRHGTESCQSFRGGCRNVLWRARRLDFCPRMRQRSRGFAGRRSWCCRREKQLIFIRNSTSANHECCDDELDHLMRLRTGLALSLSSRLAMTFSLCNKPDPLQLLHHVGAENAGGYASTNNKSRQLREAQVSGFSPWCAGQSGYSCFPSPWGAFSRAWKSIAG